MDSTGVTEWGRFCEAEGVLQKRAAPCQAPTQASLSPSYLHLAPPCLVDSNQVNRGEV